MLDESKVKSLDGIASALRRLEALEMRLYDRQYAIIGDPYALDTDTLHQLLDILPPGIMRFRVRDALSQREV